MARPVARASKPCNIHGCPNLQPCPDHGRKPWKRNRPRSKLSGSRQQTRARYILERDGGICHVCGYAGANEADHVVPLGEDGPDTIANMRAIHAKPCHENKTLEEAARARRAAAQHTT